MAILNQPIREGIIVHLSHDEVQVCQIIGRMRSLVARGNGVKDAKMGNQNGAEADVMGVTAEFAFAKHFNVFPDFGLSPRSGSADGMLHGIPYDIKSSEYQNARLLSTTKVNPDVDFYALCVVRSPIVEIKGWAWKKELIQETNKINLGHGVGYAIEQTLLRNFENELPHER